MPEISKGQVEELVKFLVQKYTFGEAIPEKFEKLSEEAVESLYAIAFTFYHNSKYDEAIILFRFLTLLDSMEKKYWIGLAACQQMSLKHEEALSAYAFASFLDPEDPKPHLHAAECYHATDNHLEALKALKLAKKYSKDEAINHKISLLESLCKEKSYV